MEPDKSLVFVADFTCDSWSEHVRDWDYIEWKSPRQGEFRLYYKSDAEIGSGVTIYVFERVEYSGKWNVNTTECQLIYKILGYFDGIRHMMCNPADEGYMNYVRLPDHIEIYKEIQKLIEKYCRDWDE